MRVIACLRVGWLMFRSLIDRVGAVAIQERGVQFLGLARSQGALRSARRGGANCAHSWIRCFCFPLEVRSIIQSSSGFCLWNWGSEWDPSCRYNIPELAKTHTVYAMDLLGFGLSEKALIDYSADVWRDQLAGFCRDVVGKPAVLAGNR